MEYLSCVPRELSLSLRTLCLLNAIGAVKRGDGINQSVLSAAACAGVDQLDGCYVVETDLPMEAATTEQVHERYLDLTRVGRDFRTLKTGLLEIRPVFVRKARQCHPPQDHLRQSL